MQDISSKLQTKQKYKPNQEQTYYHFTQPSPSEEKQRNKQQQQQLSTNLTLYEAYTKHWTKLRRAEAKKKKEFNFEAWGSEPVRLLSGVWLFAILWTVAYQAPSSMEFSRQEYWTRLPFLSPGDLPDPGIKPVSSALQADALLSEPPGKPLWKGDLKHNELKKK